MEGLGLGAKAPLRLSTEDEKFDAQISVFLRIRTSSGGTAAVCWLS